MRTARYPTLRKKFRESNTIAAIKKQLGDKIDENANKELAKLCTPKDGDKADYSVTLDSVWNKMSFATADLLEKELAALQPAAA